jgi:hypothetical protein
MVEMRPLLALAALAAMLPAVAAQTGLGLGGLAPASAPGPDAAIATNIDVPTDLCEREFCLQAAPAACGGNCILTPLGNTTAYCATACIAVWNSPAVQSCLSGQATGTYIQEQLTAIANRCNAGAIAAARRAAALQKYNTLFPCTETAAVNATTLLGLDTCQTGANATATNCGTQCSAALEAIPATCRNTFGTLSAPWATTLSTCIASATSPAGAPATGSGLGGGGGTDFLGPATSPGTAPAPQAASLKAVPSALAASALAAVIAVVVMA